MSNTDEMSITAAQQWCMCGAMLLNSNRSKNAAEVLCRKPKHGGQRAAHLSNTQDRLLDKYVD